EAYVRTVDHATALGDRFAQFDSRAGPPDRAVVAGPGLDRLVALGRRLAQALAAARRGRLGAADSVRHHGCLGLVIDYFGLVDPRQHGTGELLVATAGGGSDDRLGAVRRLAPRRVGMLSGGSGAGIASGGRARPQRSQSRACVPLI